MIYAYARVSSDSQNLDRQIAALTPYVSDPRCLITDKASGKDFDRKGYKMLVGRCRRADDQQQWSRGWMYRYKRR